MDEDATWYGVDLGPGHIVLEGVQALGESGTAAPPLSAHVYWGHGRPSQLLLSSCCFLGQHSAPKFGTGKHTIDSLLRDKFQPDQ